MIHTITLTPTRDGMMDVTCDEPHRCPVCRQMSCWFRNRHGQTSCWTCSEQEEEAQHG